MIVLLEDDLFDPEYKDPRRLGQLLALFFLGLDGRHRLFLTATEHREPAHFSTWRAARDTDTQELVDLALERGLRDEAAQLPVANEIVVAALEMPQWTERPPRLPLEVAERLLSRPMHILLENRRTDRAFLQAVAPGQWKLWLRERLKEGAVEYEHGGGSTLRTRVEELFTAPLEAIRTWVMFDSDAREPGSPSPQASEICSLCSEIDLPHHMLRRRAIENYLPLEALEWWAERCLGHPRQMRVGQVAAFAAMPPRLRHHYNLKKGFDGDRPSGIPDIYSAYVDDPDLKTGLDKNIAQLFLEGDYMNGQHEPALCFQETWLQEDGQVLETTEMLESLYAAL